MSQRVLIIDDEPDICELLEITLARMNLETASAGSLAGAHTLLLQQRFDLCLTDMRLPDGDGLALVAEIQSRFPLLPVAVITAHGSTDTAIQALKSGAFDFISKPVDLTKLRNLVASALKLNQPAARTGNSGSTLRRIVGSSPHIQRLRQQIVKLARSQAPVFISGESGSGKELVARAIHAEGPRRERAFIAINCGAIPGELMESEFFGHRKGSFTGADHDRIGLFQAAHGGTLFLDEVADLPLHMQVKLLRAIQEKSIRPVGAHSEIPVDVRLLSASHKSLADEVERGTLRQDFYYRINVIGITVPPLRERREDLPLLVEHILARLVLDSGQPAPRISSEALQALCDYPFPGNIRELENLLQRALALTDDAHIRLDDLPQLHDNPVSAASTRGAAQPVMDQQGNYSLEHHLETIERAAMQQALIDCRWNRTAAARKLGLTFRSFRYRLKKLGLD